MIFFMSVWGVAANDANSAVSPPIRATTFKLCGADSKTGYSLATIYTPAATIVEECKRADTGVGPAMAFGSHV